MREWLLVRFGFSLLDLGGLLDRRHGRLVLISARHHPLMRGLAEDPVRPLDPPCARRSACRSATNTCPGVRGLAATIDRGRPGVAPFRRLVSDTNEPDIRRRSMRLSDLPLACPGRAREPDALRRTTLAAASHPAQDRNVADFCRLWAAPTRFRVSRCRPHHVRECLPPGPLMNPRDNRHHPDGAKAVGPNLPPRGAVLRLAYAPFTAVMRFCQRASRTTGPNAISHGALVRTRPAAAAGRGHAVARSCARLRGGADRRAGGKSGRREIEGSSSSARRTVAELRAIAAGATATCRTRA